ncbi:MAG: D-glycerate dehydrogenase [Betaproteobacteria bacterium]|nr:D-glycerate dehydrogenase [Betaproteobacteria bacterium]
MKPKILITRATFDEVIDRLRERYEVEDNQRDDAAWPADELRRRAADKVGVLASSGERIDAAFLDACPKLRALCNVAVGYNNLDMAALTERGILATNTPGVLDDTTADMVWALLLGAARRLTEGERWMRAGNWKGWKNDQFLGQDVHHATLGIIGMGRIGQAVARRAKGFDMRVLYCNRNRVSAEIERDTGAIFRSMDALLRESDFVSLNLPYTAESHHLIAARELALMKPTAILINAARGGIIDEDALAQALRERRIAGAGLDVFEGEPKVNPALYELDNVALAPHIGSATRATRLKMNHLAVDNLDAILEGKVPPSLLNPEALARRRRA